jgi:lipase (class 2)
VLFVGFAVDAQIGIALDGPGGPPLGCRIEHDARRRVFIAMRGVFDQLLLGQLETLGLASPRLLDGAACLATTQLELVDLIVAFVHASTVLARVVRRSPRKLHIVGHSQGGMMPRYYLKFLGGAQRVHTLIGLSPSNHGTTVDGLTNLLAVLPGRPETGGLELACGPSCEEQFVGSAFLTNLNAGGDTVPGVSYAVIETRWVVAVGAASAK